MLFPVTGSTFRDSSNVSVPIDITEPDSLNFAFSPSTILGTSFHNLLGNQFVLYVTQSSAPLTKLSDTSNFGYIPIGKYTFDSAVYTTFVNGYFPSGAKSLPAGTYYLRVVSTYPFVCSDSVQINIFSSSNPIRVRSFTHELKANPLSVIHDDPTQIQKFYGTCFNDTITHLVLNDSSFGATQWDSLILIQNSYTNSANVNNIVLQSLITPGTPVNLPMVKGNYYTLRLKAKNLIDGCESSVSYFLLNSLWVINMSSAGNVTNCTKQVSTFYVPLDQRQTPTSPELGIIDNFPGSLYKIAFGDPKKPAPVYTSYSQIVKDTGILSYTYDSTSCFSPGSQYLVTDSLLNYFSGIKCVNAFTQLNIKVLASAKAKIGHPILPKCPNTVDTFIDSSYAGYGTSNGGCTGLAYYKWYAAYVGCGSLSDTATYPFVLLDSTYPNAVAHYNLVDSFPLADSGKVYLKLIAENASCNTDAVIDSFMLVKPSKAGFQFDSVDLSNNHTYLDSMTGCSPKTFRVTNQSGVTCTQPSTFTWAVLDANMNVVAPGVVWKFGGTSTATDTAPNFIINSQGRYYVRLIASNVCIKSDTIIRPVNVVGVGNVFFNNPIVSQCSNKYDLIYTAGGANSPTYSGTASGLFPYQWKVVPVTAGGTAVIKDTVVGKVAVLKDSSTAQYPSFTLYSPTNNDDNGQFTVTVNYMSQCGLTTAVQTVNLYRPLVVKIYNPTVASIICANSTIIPVCDTVYGADGVTISNNYDPTSTWSNTSTTGMTGTYDNANALCGNFNISNPGVGKDVTFTYTAKVIQPNVCPNATASVKVTLQPAIVNQKDTLFSVCSGSSWIIDLTKRTTGTIYNWTSSWTVGTGTGNTVSGTANSISDVLTSPNGGTVRYVITPSSANGCVGNVFYVTVNVLAIPVLQIKDASFKDTICSSSPLSLYVNGTPNGTSYNWTYTMLGVGNNAAVYGTQPASSQSTPGFLTPAFSNPDAHFDSIKILLSPVAVLGGASCPGPNDSVVIYIPPGQTVPIANTINDIQYLCNQPTFTMNANTATIGTGTWTQSFPSLPIASFNSLADLNNPSAVISNLQDTIYRFIWTISSVTVGCPSLSDSVTIYNRPPVTTATANPRTISNCNYVAGTNASINIAANPIPAYRTYDNGKWTIYSEPVGAVGTFASSATTTSALNKNTDKFNFKGPAGNYILLWTINDDAGCSASTDTLTILSGFTNNVISGDTGICLGQAPDSLRGTIPSSGGASTSYQWYIQPTPGGAFNAIANATLQSYLPPTPIVIGISKYFRKAIATCGSANSDTIAVRVFPIPKASFKYSQDTVCAPFTFTSNIIKVDTATYKADTTLSYQWFVNNNSIGTGLNFPGYVISIPGDTARVKLIVTSSKGCTPNDSMIHTFNAFIKPAPSFTYVLPNGACNTTQVTLTNTTPNRYQMYGQLWNYVVAPYTDTIYQPTISPILAAANGKDSIYCLNLKTWTKPACHDTTTYTQCISILSKPHASFYPSHYSGCAPLLDSFYNTSIGKVDSCVFYWNYPDPLDTSIVYNTNPITHSIPTTTNVVLKVYNSCGIDSTNPINIQAATTAVNLSVGISLNDQYACSPHTSDITYNAAGANKVEIWVKNFGLPTPDYVTDVTSGTFTVPFTNSGKYYVQVRGSNICDVNTQLDSIQIYRTPVAKFTISTPIICIGDSLKTTNLTDTTASYFWNFGTLLSPSTYNAADVNPTVAFGTVGSDSISLATTISYPSYSPGYCTDTIKLPITVIGTKKASVTISNNKPSCLPAAVTFTNNSPSGGTPPTVWYLNYPSVLPADVANGNSANYTYTDTGTYTVILDTKSVGGCFYTDTEKIVVSSPFAQVWNYDYGVICGTTPVRFQVVNPSGVDSGFLWHFGDGTTQFTNFQTSTVYHSYTQCNNYQPSVDLYSKGGCKYTMNWIIGDTIKVDSVKAGFVYVINKSCGSTNVSFTDTSRACSGFNANSWSWNFGDLGLPTNFSTQQNPNHTYPITDNDTIQLTVTANSGCASTVKVPIAIVVKNLPQIATHKITPENGLIGCTGQTVFYSGTATSIDPIKDYVWTFSQGQPQLGASVTNTYSTSGTYYDTLTVNTVNGCTATSFGSLVVNTTPSISINQANLPQICLGVNPYPLTAVSTDPTVSYTWGPVGGSGGANLNFNCVNPPRCSQVTIQPSSSSTVYVQGASTNGCTGYSDTIKVLVVQPIALTASPLFDTICIGASVQLNSVASGATLYTWTKDSTLSADSIPNPIATPTSVGDHLYKLVVTNGCFTDSATLNIAVGAYPSVVLGTRKGIDTIYVQTGSTIPMNNYVALSPDTYQTFTWTPSTGLNCNNCQNPIISVTGSELYSLEATTIYGCSDKDYMYVSTFCQNSQVYIPNAFTPDGDGKNDILMVRGSGIKQVKSFRIYNRWGQIVFERGNFNVNDPQFGWDGKIRNTSSFAQPDVYVYYCEVVCDNDVPFTYQGNITLLK